MPFYHNKKTPASNALTDLIRAVLRMNATVQKSGTRLMRGTGVTNGWQTLSELFALEKRVTVSELARHMGFSRQAVQRLADDMASYAGFSDQVRDGFASIVPPDTDVSAVADAIVNVVNAPFGKRPFRVHIDPSQDGAEVVNAVSDRVRAELLRRVGLENLLRPATPE